jgi:hypothetical protein
VLGVLAMHLSQMLQYQAPVMRVTALVVDCGARRRRIGNYVAAAGWQKTFPAILIAYVKS